MSTIVERIVARTLPAEIIYEDDDVIAFMDINPINQGHALICPKNPYPDFMAVPDDTLLLITQVAKQIYTQLSTRYTPDGIGFLQNNGAFNELNHYHLHIYPCYKDSKGRVNIKSIGKRSAQQLSCDAQGLHIAPIKVI
jgi:histidine triad (HIT) family protein